MMMIPRRCLRALSSSSSAPPKNSQLWGFYPQSHVASVLSEQKVIIKFLENLQKQSPQDTAKEFNLSMPSLQLGLQVAYRRLAQLLEASKPNSFKESDLVDAELSRALDYQLELFCKQKKLPRLHVSDVKAEIVGLWVFPKFATQKLQQYVKGTSLDFLHSLPFHYRAMLYNVVLYIPGNRELVLGVEFTVKERFALISDDEGAEPARKYVDEFEEEHQGGEKMEEGKEEGTRDTVENDATDKGNEKTKAATVQVKEEEIVEEKVQSEDTPTTKPDDENLMENKYYFVFTAQVDDDDSTQNIEFKLTLMNEPFDYFLGM